jgi:uncharacterized membrane protein
MPDIPDSWDGEAPDTFVAFRALQVNRGDLVMSPVNIIRLVVLFVAALATGAMMVNWVGLARAMLRISTPSAYAELHQASNTTFDPYMPVVVNGAILGGIALAALSRGYSFSLAVLGALCYATVVLLSLSTNVRMNKQVARWSAQNPPSDWSTFRARWVRFHILRTLISVPALLFYLIAALGDASV